MDADNIKQTIKDYISLDEEITEINKSIKELRSNKNKLEDIIKQYMLKDGIAQLNTKNGSIKISKSKASRKVNKKIISEILSETLEESKANDILHTLFDDSNEEEVVKIELKKIKR